MKVTTGLTRVVACLAAGSLFSAATGFAGEGEQVVVTYYHGTIRCFTCLEIERLSRKTLEERFADRLAAGELEWRAVDYDLPKNASAIERYNLTSPSLIISRREDGRETGWRLAGETWQRLAVSSEALMDYVERVVEESGFGTVPDPGQGGRE